MPLRHYGFRELTRQAVPDEAEQRDGNTFIAGSFHLHKSNWPMTNDDKSE